MDKQLVKNKPAIKEKWEDSQKELVPKPHQTQGQIMKQKYSEIFRSEKRVCTEKCKSAFCNQEDDMWVLCDICEEWYHYQCVGIDQNTFQSDSEWFCYTCSV